MAQIPSIYQTGCYDFVTSGTGNAIIEAVAGSGKTTTGVNMVKLIPQGRSHIFLAFNRAIAAELKSRGINGRTFHSLCMSPVLSAKGVRDVNTDKLRNIIDEAIEASESGNFKQDSSGEWYMPGFDGSHAKPPVPVLSLADARMYGKFMTRLVGLARNSGVGCLCQNIPEVWQGLVDYHDLDFDNEGASFERGIELSRTLLEWSNNSTMLDFDDVLYMAVKDGISLPKFDFVFVDEAQDTNSIQRAILRKLMKPTTRLIAVGDPAQAIYGFRGADSNSLDMIASEFSCKRLPLTVTYRCPTSVVDFAKQWVSHIEAAPNAAVGVVRDVGTKWETSMFKSDDLVVCRTMRPLIGLCYQLIKARVPARILGRNIGEGLKSLVKRMNAKGIDALLDKLADYTEREYEKAIAKGKEAKAEAIKDKTDSILCLIEGLGENERTIPALLNTIDELFSDSTYGVTLATIHKSKGLEADRVFWLNASQCPAQWARQPWQKQQEKNLCYVATTRAKQELVTFEEKAEGVKQSAPKFTNEEVA